MCVCIYVVFKDTLSSHTHTHAHSQERDMPPHLQPPFSSQTHAHKLAAHVCVQACQPIALIYLPLKKTRKKVEEGMREVELHLPPPSVDYLNFLAEGPC